MRWIAALFWACFVWAGCAYLVGDRMNATWRLVAAVGALLAAAYLTGFVRTLVRRLGAERGTFDERRIAADFRYSRRVATISDGRIEVDQATRDRYGDDLLRAMNGGTGEVVTRDPEDAA